MTEELNGAKEPQLCPKADGCSKAATCPKAVGFDPKEYLQQGAWRDVRLGLTRTEELLERLGRPQDGLKFVHIAGTNGKGSTSAFTAGILQAAGYKTGLFTSPYILRFNERIQVNRQDISDEDLYAVTAEVRKVALTFEDHPTAFELITAVALLYFQRVGCDVVVLEVGLGGRLDSTNVVTPLVTAITPVALDHTHVLGDTLGKIAFEKAGIIKKDVPLVCYDQEPEADEVIRARAAEENAPVIRPRFQDLQARAEGLCQVFSYGPVQDVRLRLVGVYQPRNAVMAIEIAQVLRGCDFQISDQQIKEGLQGAVWQGRFEVVANRPGRPTVIVDGGHNEQGAKALADSLRTYFPDGGVTFVMSVLKDKNYRAMIEDVVPLAERFFVSMPPDNIRALPPKELAEELRSAKARLDGSAPAEDFATPCEDVQHAVRSAAEAAGANGVVCCFGSLYAIQPIMEELQALGL